MAKSKKDMEGGLGIHARRAIAYIVLIIISFFCLFWFYIMFINATRSKGELKAGFTALPSDHLLTNWNNQWNKGIHQSHACNQFDKSECRNLCRNHHNHQNKRINKFL